MTFNQFMHPRNIYKTKPNFKLLSEKYPEFRNFVNIDSNEKCSVDFKNPAALRALTTVCLHHDFGLDVHIPEDKLVPTLPSRLNYILWIEDLLGTINQEDKKIVSGIDVGTGACCIYALLGCAKNGWKFFATEVNKTSVESARLNITRNKLEDSIKVLEIGAEEPIFPANLFHQPKFFHFSICNPPFYDSEAELRGDSSSRTEPSSTNTGSNHETITDGGEIKFVMKMISESTVLKDKVLIYSSLLGKKSSINQLKQELIYSEVASYATTTFCQGNTMRWGIAWTFNPDLKLDQLQVDTSKTKIKKPKPKPPLVFQVPKDYTMKELLQKILQIADKLQMHHKILKKTNMFTVLKVCAEKNTWSHQRRKRREKVNKKSDKSEAQMDSRKPTDTEEYPDHKPSGDCDGESVSPPSKRLKFSEEESSDVEIECVLECTVLIKVSEERGVRLEFQWLRGSLGRDAMHQFLQFIKNTI